MAKLGDFIAFQAAVQLLKDNFKENLLDELYEKAKAQENLPKEEITNVVKEIYDLFSKCGSGNNLSNNRRIAQCLSR